MPPPRPHPVSYAAVAISAALLVTYLLTLVIQLLPGTHHQSTPLAFYGSLALGLLFLTAIAAGLVLELRRSPAATWVNLGWSALALFLGTSLVGVETIREAIPRMARIAAVSTTALTFAIPLALYTFFYRSRLKPTDPQAPLTPPALETTDPTRDALLARIALWLSPALLAYPVFLYLSLRHGLLSKQLAATLELLLFLTSLLTVVILAFSFRATGRRRPIAIAAATLALILNFLLLFLAALAI